MSTTEPSLCACGHASAFCHLLNAQKHCPPAGGPVIEALVRVVKDMGYEVQVGDFTRKDGSRSPFHLVPKDSKKIARHLLRALEQS